MAKEKSTVRSSEVAAKSKLCTHPAIADYCLLSRTEFEHFLTKHLLTPDKIHFQRVELFLKGIFVYALQQNNKSLIRVIDWTVKSYISKECAMTDELRNVSASTA